MSETNYKKKIFTILFCFFSFLTIAQNSCVENTTLSFFKPSINNNSINFEQFPDFKLPFKIIFGGPRFADSQQLPLKKGFSHLGSFNEFDYQQIRPQNRAIIWYGVAYNFNEPQPWDLIRSPWNNNIVKYEQKWKSEIESFGSNFTLNGNKTIPETDILVLDIERHWEGETDFNTDFGIFSIKNNPIVPINYRLLTNENFKTRYKNDMQSLYAKPISYLNSINKLSKISYIGSYGDTPVRSQFQNIESQSWSQWISNGKNLSYLLKDTLKADLGGLFNSQLNIINPSCYIQNPYLSNPKTQGGSYLAEILFQIEVNKKWANRPIIPFVWLRYESNNQFVASYQAEAMAIFPFLAGASGLWLWENPTINVAIENLSAYEHFTKGLYKLSQFKNFFEGNFEIIEADNPVDLKVKSLPVWRGVFKDSKILIAVHNPYAAENEKTIVTVKYKKWSKEIELNGREVHLCAYDYKEIVPTEIENKLNINIVNPIINNTLQINFTENSFKRKCEIQLFDLTGKVIIHKINKNITNAIVINNLPKGLMFLKIFDGKIQYSKKIINY